MARLNKPTPIPPLAVPAAVGIIAYGAMVAADRATGTLRARTTPITIALYLLAFVAYIAAMRRAERWDGAQSESNPRPDGPPLADSPHVLRFLWLAPVVFRLLLLATEPTLSDDVYRFLWDGHVLSNGVNPYSHAISSAELDGLATPGSTMDMVRRLANNPQLASPYLPTTQLLFAGLALLAPTAPLTIQLSMVVFDLAAALAIRQLLAMAELPPWRVLLYLWNPLVVVESAHGAHFDSLMTLLALLSVYWACRGPSRGVRTWLSPLALAAATLTRPIPILLVPVLWWRWTWPQRVFFAVGLVVAVTPFAFGPSGLGLFGAPDGTGVFGSARVYSAEFRFNAVVATWLERLVASPEAFSVTIVGLMAVVLGVVWLLARKPASGRAEESALDIRRTLRLAAIPLAAYLALTPVLHPWYLVSLIAFGCFIAPARSEDQSRWFWLAPIGYASAAVVFSYLTYLDPTSFGELTWVRRLEWFPVLALVGLAATRLSPSRAGPGRSVHEPTGTS